MKERIKLVRTDKTEAFSDGLNKLLCEIHDVNYSEYQTCLAYFSFVMARHIMSSESFNQFGAHTILRETLAYMKAACIFGVHQGWEAEFPQKINGDKVCTFIDGDKYTNVWEIDLDA